MFTPVMDCGFSAVSGQGEEVSLLMGIHGDLRGTSSINGGFNMFQYFQWEDPDGSYAF